VFELFGRAKKIEEKIFLEPSLSCFDFLSFGNKNENPSISSPPENLIVQSFYGIYRFYVIKREKELKNFLSFS